jgi:hypothetical protein
MARLVVFLARSPIKWNKEWRQMRKIELAAALAALASHPDNYVRHKVTILSFKPAVRPASVNAERAGRD